MSTEDKYDKVFKELYYDKKSPLLFADKRRLYQAVKGKLKNVSPQDVQRFLASQRVHTLYKKPPPKFVRRQLLSPGPWHELSIDLADFSKYVGHTKNRVKWLLVCVDLFSKYLYLECLKKKDGHNMQISMKKILNTPPLVKSKVRQIWGDEGNENKVLVKTVLQKDNIKLIHTRSPLKALLSERLIAKCQKDLFRLCTFFNTLDWAQFVPLVAYKHNHTKLRAINFYTPMEVVTSQKITQNLKLANARKMIRFNNKQGLSPKFNLQDRVRVLLDKKLWRKAYLPSWSESTYIISHVYPTFPITYSIREKNSDKSLHRRYYTEELQKIETPQVRDHEDVSMANDERQPTAEQNESEKQYYLTGREKKVEGRKLRSGASLPDKVQYEIKDKKDPFFHQFISPEKRDEMIKNKELS